MHKYMQRRCSVVLPKTIFFLGASALVYVLSIENLDDMRWQNFSVSVLHGNSFIFVEEMPDSTNYTLRCCVALHLEIQKKNCTMLSCGNFKIIKSINSKINVVNYDTN
jgi:hypothetical protein